MYVPRKALEHHRKPTPKALLEQVEKTLTLG